MKKNDKGQLTALGVLMLLLTVLVIATVMPTIIDNTTNVSEDLNASGFTYESVLVRMIPLFIIVAFLATIALYAAPMTR